MIALASGCVRPTGWVRKVAELEIDGWMEMIFRKDEHNLRKSFYDGTPYDGTPALGGEWPGYWNDSFIGLGLLLGDEYRLSRVREHVEAMLSASEKKERVLSEHYDGWGSYLQTKALMTYYEATGDERILSFCHRVALELLDDLNSPDGHKCDGDHQVNMASSCAQIYGYTADERMLLMAEEIMARFDAGAMPNLRRLLNDERIAGHCVVYCEAIRHPADVYLFSGNPKHLEASRRGVELTLRDHMQVQGVPTGNEPVNGKGPMKETEHCDTVEWSMVGHTLLAATGEVRYADLAEKALFNAWAGSRKWDSRSLCYNHAPNQITASSWEGIWTPRMNYSPHHQPLCCNLNSHRALHPYAFRMWMMSGDGAPSAVYYGDCHLKVEVPNVGAVEFIETTDYPFGEDVSIVVNPEKAARFPVSLRIPGWCNKAVVSVNGKGIASRPKAGTFFIINRIWKPGDRLDLRLTMTVALEWCETVVEPAVHDFWHPDTNHEHPTQIGLRPVEKPIPGRQLVAMSRGPLVYALYIKPKFIVETDEQGIEGYPVENVIPADDASPWNVALMLDRKCPEESFEFCRLEFPRAGAPFQYPPVGLKCKARLVEHWKPAGTPDRPLTTLPEFPYEVSGKEIELLLVPFGCTRIRLTWLPFGMY